MPLDLPSRYERVRSRNLLAHDFFFLLIIAVVLYLRLFLLPNIPIDPAQGDQADFLWGATNILDGKVIYKDFVQFTTPGTEYLYAFLIRLFGQTAILPKLVTWAIGVIFTWQALKASRFLLTGWRVYLPALLFLSAGFLPTQVSTHHAFSTMTAIGGMLLLAPDRQSAWWRFAGAGALIGISFCFTPTRGALMIVALLTFVSINEQVRRRQKPIMALVAGFIVAAMMLLSPVLMKAGKTAILQNLIYYPIHEYRMEPWNNISAYFSDFPLLSNTSQTVTEAAILVTRWGLTYLIVPWVYIFVAMTDFRNPSPNQPLQKAKLLLCLAGSALFLSISYAPTQFRMGVVSLPAAVLLVAALAGNASQISKMIIASLYAFAAVTLPAGIIHSQTNKVVLVTPSGKIALSRTAVVQETKYVFLQSHTQPGDYFFSTANLEYDYLFRLRHTSPVASMSVFAYTTDEQVRLTVQQMEEQKPKFVFLPVDSQVVTANTEAIRGADDHLKPLRSYLIQRYDRIRVFQDFDEVWQRKSGSDPR
jgi:hypothetical protein